MIVAYPVTIALVSNDNRAISAQTSYPHGEAEWLALDDGERQEFIDEAIAEHFLVLANGKSLAEWNESTCNDSIMWAVIGNTDGNEGRGNPYVIFLCHKQSTAIRIAKGRGPMGSCADVEQVVNFKIKGIYQSLSYQLDGMPIEHPNDADLASEVRK